MKNKYLIIILILILISLIFTVFRESFKVPPAKNYVFVNKWGGKGDADGLFNIPASIAVDFRCNVYVSDFYNHRIQVFDCNGNFISKWGVKGRKEGEITGPGDLAVYKKNVYLLDCTTERIQKYDLKGNFITQWYCPKNISHLPACFTDITADSHGNLFVVDINNNTIQKYDSQGNFITLWKKIWRKTIKEEGRKNPVIIIPQRLVSVAIDSNDYLYAGYSIMGSFGFQFDDDKPVDEKCHESYIQKLAPSGEFIEKWSSFNGESEELNNIHGIAIDSYDRLFVADTSNNRILLLDTEGNLITKWGSKGSEDGQFRGPVDVTVDFRGNVYVVDYINNRIQKFAPQHNK